VTVFAAQWRPRRDQARAKLAAVAGAAIRRVGLSVPGVGGPLLVALGLWMAWRPLGVVFAGAVLWALDRRVP
jgi:hypothetical protein